MKNPPGGCPRIAPPVFYNDAATAIDWLTGASGAFGFAVRERVENDAGQIVHSQLVLDGGLIMVGQVGLHPGRTYPRSPLAVGGANTQSLAVYVDDVDAHCERARAAGAAITVEPATDDYGEGYWVDRSYEARDPEGHHWWFLQRLR